MKRTSVLDVIHSEQELCALFMREFNEVEGWTCYPETGGFDVVVVHETGRQIGVEAKLKLNAKVADQILPTDSHLRYGGPGPDHRMVIVGSITEANAGIARLLGVQGIKVWAPYLTTGRLADGDWGDVATFQVEDKLRLADSVAEDAGNRGHWGWCGFFDWNPVERIQLPIVVPQLPAGVPGPVQMTPWKQAAMRVVALLRVQGYITTKQIASEGCSPSNWIQRWLVRGSAPGHWVESPSMPAFDKQHPELYEVVLKAIRARAAGEATT